MVAIWLSSHGFHQNWWEGGWILDQHEHVENVIWLLVQFHHLEKYEFVNGKDDIPYMK
jgi:hypothetical protein